jgi:hypothetical protein
MAQESSEGPYPLIHEGRDDRVLKRAAQRQNGSALNSAHLTCLFVTNSLEKKRFSLTAASRVLPSFLSPDRHLVRLLPKA